MVIPLFKVFMNDDTAEKVGNVLSGGMITQGPQVEKFEAELKKFFNYPYVLTINSATSGLTLAYRLLNLEKGDKVISSPLTCFATNAAIMANGLDIVWCDVDPKTCNIDLSNVLGKLDQTTKALSIVHWGGNPVNMDEVDKVVSHAEDKHGAQLHIVEDCAHAFGAEWNGKKLGTTGKTIAVYSTQAIKHLTTGDGGIILLPNEEMYKRAKLMRWYGIDREKRSLPGKDFRLESDIPEYGYKFHMNDINATIGLSNLSHMDRILKRCSENGRYYNENLRDVFGLELLDYQSNHDPSYWIYTVKILFGLKEEFMTYMNKNNVIVSQVHMRNDSHTCVAKYKSRELPQLDLLEKQICSIPVGWWLTNSDTKHIVHLIRNFFVNNVRIEHLQLEDIEKYRDLLSHMNGYKSDEYNKENINGIYVIKGKNGDLLSTAKLHVEKKIYNNLGHIEDVVTLPCARGNGYGRELVKFLSQKGIRDGCYKIVLSSEIKNNEFYIKCGFVQSGCSYTYRV